MDGGHDISVGGQAMRWKTKRNLPRYDKVQYKLIFKNTNITHRKVSQQVAAFVDEEDKPILIEVNITKIDDSPDNINDEATTRRFLKPRLADFNSHI